MFVASTAWAQENGTAYNALRVVGTKFNREAVNHVISVTGVDGTPQPAKWKILLADKRARGGVREIGVANGRVVSNARSRARRGRVDRRRDDQNRAFES